MHDHNNNNHKNMMWMMAICCLLPIVILLFVGTSSFGGRFSWQILVFLVFVVSCFWLLRRKNSNLEDQNKNENPTQEHGEHKDGCCH